VGQIDEVPGDKGLDRGKPVSKIVRRVFGVGGGDRLRRAPAGSPLVELVRRDRLTDGSILGLLAVPLLSMAVVQSNRES
jgi:hypothetical protein